MRSNGCFKLMQMVCSSKYGFAGCIDNAHPASSETSYQVQSKESHQTSGAPPKNIDWKGTLTVYEGRLYYPVTIHSGTLKLEEIVPQTARSFAKLTMEGKVRATLWLISEDKNGGPLCLDSYAEQCNSVSIPGNPLEKNLHQNNHWNHQSSSSQTPLNELTSLNPVRQDWWTADL